MISYFILNVFINSFFSFLTACLLVEIFLMPLKSPRLTYYCRLVPFLKLPLDLFFYDFSSWSLLKGVNPLYQPQNSRMITLETGYFPGNLRAYFQLADGSTFSLADWWLLMLDPSTVQFLAYSFVFITLGALGIGILRFRAEKKALHLLLKRSIPIFLKHPKTLLTYDNISPFVTCDKTLVLPASLLEELTPEELDAIIAHELNHLKWYDPYTRLLTRMIHHLFWWVPTGYFLRRAEYANEIACDKSTLKQGVKPLDLGQAILKCAHQRSSHCSFSKAHPVASRIKTLLTPQLKTRFQLVIAPLILFMMFQILQGRFWIF